MTIHWKVVERYFTVVLFVFSLTNFIILEKLSILELALSGVKGLRCSEDVMFRLAFHTMLFCVVFAAAVRSKVAFSHEGEEEDVCSEKEACWSLGNITQKQEAISRRVEAIHREILEGESCGGSKL